MSGLLGQERKPEPDDLDFGVFRLLFALKNELDRQANLRFFHEFSKLSRCFRSLRSQRL